VTESSSVQNERLNLFRREIGGAILLDTLTLGLWFSPLFPFPRAFFYFALASLMLHLSVLAVYYRRETMLRTVLIGASFLNMGILALVMHFTGGIISPFAFIFLPILISATAYGVQSSYSFFSATLMYILVVLLEAAGIVEPVSIRPQDIYACRPLVALIAINFIGALTVASFLYKGVLKILETQIAAEHRKKESFMKRLADLEAPSQVGMLVSKVVHDIQGPLGAIQGFVHFLSEEKALSDEAREDCRLMQGELKRVSQLLSGLLRYTRPSDQKAEDIDPAAALDTVLSVLSFHPLAKGIDFFREVRMDPLRVRCNREQLQQIFFNILKNSAEALREVPPPRRVRIELGKMNGRFRTEISDNGPGIPEGVLTESSGRKRTTKKDGSGLGLAITRELLESYGGSLELANEDRGGARVTLWLPSSGKRDRGK